jgi:peptidoglycan hydrolase-like protein with peptidoglycan-binding domain
MRWRTKLASILMGLCVEVPAHAAAINVIPYQKSSLVIIKGELQLGDEDTFTEKVLRLKEAVVMFNSPGGNLVAGLEIGRAIRLKGFDTFVPDGMVCASACALAWLGGKTLLAGRRAQIGFHAAWAMEGGQKRETGPGNALVGAYLHSLGFRDEAIVYLTLASPDDAKWLNFKDAQELGIHVKEVPSIDEPSKRVAEAPSEYSNNPEKPTVPDAVYLDSDVSSEPKAVPPAPTISSQEVRTAGIPRQQADPRIWHRPEAPQLEPQVLNLVNLDAAAQVQRRLQERGFFAGIVDGVWGPKSRVALRDFKIQNGLGADDSWNLQVQLALFDDRYRVAAIGYVPPDPSISTDGLFQPFAPVPGTTLHPLNPQDARIIQGELFELGYYRKHGDGIWGEASRGALQDFRLANGLPADDVWDSRVQSLLTGGRAISAIETPFGQWAKTGTSCTDPSNPSRLSVSAKEITAGRGICRMAQSLAHSRDMWLGNAVCSRDGQEAPAHVALRIVEGQLIDESILGRVPNPRPTVFERCRF